VSAAQEILINIVLDHTASIPEEVSPQIPMHEWDQWVSGTQNVQNTTFFTNSIGPDLVLPRKGSILDPCY